MIGQPMLSLKGQVLDIELAMKNELSHGSDETLNSVLEVFQALSHPVRLEICQILMLRQHSVGTLCALLDMKQYKVSQQLAVLRKAQIVTARRDARRVIYALSSTKVRRILLVSIANLASANSYSLSDLDRKQQAGRFAEIL